MIDAATVAQPKTHRKPVIQSLGWIVLVSAGVFFLALLFYGPTSNFIWDTSYYYAQLRSPLIDGDLDWRFEVEPKPKLSQATSTGLFGTAWPFGASLMWAPFFTLGHWLTQLLFPHRADGFSSLYMALVAAGSGLYGLLGTGVLYLLGCQYRNRQAALITAALALLATPLFYYTFRSPFMAHTCSLLVAALLIYVSILFDRGQLPLKYSGLLMGVLIGLTTMIRHSAGLLAFFPVGLLGLYGLEKARQKDWATVKAVGLQLIIMALVGLVTFLPQMSLWYRLYNDWFAPHNLKFAPDLIITNLYNMWFSTNRGIILWLPFMVIGITGIFFLDNRKVKLLSLAYLAAFFLVYSGRADWYGGGAFGDRFFIETLPIGVIGFVTLIGKIDKYALGRLAIAVLSLALIIHQFALLIYQEQTPDISMDLHAQYMAGLPVGLHYQLDSLSLLVRSPAILVTDRPYVDDSREPVVTNLLAGRTGRSNYTVPAAGVLILPIGVLLTLLLYARFGMRWVWWIIGLVPLYCLAWFVYFLVL